MAKEEVVSVGKCCVGFAGKLELELDVMLGVLDNRVDFGGDFPICVDLENADGKVLSSREIGLT